ncbi:hypothetical protein CerSpe_271500 [Prunus speciosa]
MVRKKPYSLEEREGARREQIFSRDLKEVKCVKQKPRGVAVVARRMIAHALGQRINPSSQDSLNVQGKVEDEPGLAVKKKTPQKQVNQISGGGNSIPQNGTTGHGDGVDEEYFKRERLVAAKRMFAHALEFRDVFSKCSEINHVDTESMEPIRVSDIPNTSI